jgi:hypothetical protein
MNTIGSRWKRALQVEKFSFLAALAVLYMAHGTGATPSGSCGHLFLKNLKVIDFCVTKYKYAARHML